MHLDDRINSDCRRNKSAKFRPVGVQHPPVSTDESAHAALGELANSRLNETDVYVAHLTPHRPVQVAVHLEGCRGRSSYRM